MWKIYVQYIRDSFQGGDSETELDEVGEVRHVLLQVALLVHQHLQPGQVGQAAQLVQPLHQHPVKVYKNRKPGVGCSFHLALRLQCFWHKLNLPQLLQVHKCQLTKG